MKHFNFLNIGIGDEKKHHYFDGVLYDSQNEIVEPIFDDGENHENYHEPFTLVLNESRSFFKSRDLTDSVASIVSNSGILFLISPKAQNIFGKLVPNQILMFEVKVIAKDFQLSDYKIVKVTDKIDCVDLMNSEIEYDEDFDLIESAKSITLNYDVIAKEQRVFLLGKREDGVIMIHDDLKREIIDTGLTNFQFLSLSEASQILV